MQDKSPENKLLQNVKILYPFYNYEINSGDKDATKKIIKNDNFLLKQQFDNQMQFFTILIFANKSDIAEITKLDNYLIQQCSNSSVIKKEISLWKKNLENKLKLTEENLTRNEILLKKKQNYFMKFINQQTNILGISSQSQSIILKYIGSIDSYQKEIFSLQKSISVKKLELENCEAKIYGFGDVYSERVDATSITILLVLGFIVS